MRQLTLVGDQRLDWVEVPDPVLPGPGGALVRPVAVATCDFDHLLVSGAAGFRPPLAIGHECVGQVVELGQDVRGVRAGDLVVLPYQVNCGSCEPCRRGRTASCARLPWLSCYGLGAPAGGWGGAVADLVAVPYADAMLLPLPDLPVATAAALSCNIPDAYRAVAPLLDTPGGAVLVAGGAFGSIGLFAVALARALGAERVDYVDADPARTAQAVALGATAVTAAGIEPGRYPVTVEASMDPALLRAVVEATAPAGTCTATTMFVRDGVDLPIFTMFRHCLTFRTGQPDVRALLPVVIDLIGTGRFDPGVVPHTVRPWAAAAEAFAVGTGKTVCVRD